MYLLLNGYRLAKFAAFRFVAHPLASLRGVLVGGREIVVVGCIPR